MEKLFSLFKKTSVTRKSLSPFVHTMVKSPLKTRVSTLIRTFLQSCCMALPDSFFNWLLKARGIDKREIAVRLHAKNWVLTVQPCVAAGALTQTVKDQVQQVAKLAGVSVYWDRYTGTVSTRGLEHNIGRRIYTGYHRIHL